MRDAIDRWAGALDRLVARGPAPEPTLRYGLAVVILLAGIHKIVAPGAWAPYLAPVFAGLFPVGVGGFAFGVEEFMVFLGLTEPPFAAMFALDRFTTFAGAVVAVSIAATVVDLLVLWVQTGTGMDVLIRDLAVLTLGAGVALRSAREARGGSGAESE